MIKRLSAYPILLTESEDEARVALKTISAAVLLNNNFVKKELNEKIHLIFDWDSTVASNDEHHAVKLFGNGRRPSDFTDYEWENRLIPHQEGPLYNFLMSVNNIKNIDISILTARTGKESFRVMSTLAHWGVNVHGIYFCGSKEKGPIVAAIGGDMFFDDRICNVQSAIKHNILAAWVPIQPFMPDKE